jgi:predicted nucleotidyltransferase
MSTLVSSSEYARRKGISSQRVRQLLKAGRVPGARKIGRNWIVPLEAVAERSSPQPAGRRRGARTASGSAREWLERVALPALLRSVRPQRVLLFGSHATGHATRDSDLDLCVVLDSDEDFFRRSVRVQAAIPRGPFPLDVVAYTPREMEAGRDLPFFRAILERGVILYGRGTKP